MIQSDIKPSLSDVAETLLWTLHNRASEAKRKDKIIEDPKAIEIYDNINYDFDTKFGKPEASHPVRSLIFDNEIEKFIKEYPYGNIINLGEGLETQRFRINSEKNIWYSIDLLESIHIRENFITPDDSHKHIPASVLSTDWIKQMPEDQPAIITAQGLLMYFKEKDVKWILNKVAKNFSNS